MRQMNNGWFHQSELPRFVAALMKGVPSRYLDRAAPKYVEISFRVDQRTGDFNVLDREGSFVAKDRDGKLLSADEVYAIWPELKDVYPIGTKFIRGLWTGAEVVGYEPAEARYKLTNKHGAVFYALPGDLPAHTYLDYYMLPD